MTSTTSAVPKYFQTMSPTPPAPQSSALPPSNNPAPESPDISAPSSASSTLPTVKPQRAPLLRLELRDLSSEGSRAFLRLLHASITLEESVDTVLRLLYSGLDTKCIPPTRSITLVLRNMGGVAYTTGLDIDDDHKEIHFCTSYISQVPSHRQKEEMQGVIVHELVHCWQHNGRGTAPGGLIEGIADWVRLKAGFAPPHWRRHADGTWDGGYERTGYFLEFLEKEHGVDIVRKINESLRAREYDEGPFWEGCCGKKVDVLWEEYKATLGDGKESKQNDKQEEAEEEESTTCAEPEGAKNDDLTSNNDEETQTTKDEDTRSEREKARRGGNMHVPVHPRPGADS